MAARAETQPAVDISMDVRAVPRVVIESFFDGMALARWWPATRSVTTPRPLGPYAVEWMTETRDEELGRLGGVLRGTIMQFEPTRGFFVADLYWLPPDAGPIGPMALDVSCALGLSQDGRPATTLHVTQSGFDESPRWRRYYEVVQATWPDALDALKTHLERRP